MLTLPEDQHEEDQNTIPILIILATVGYYSTGRYEKIPCRTSSLSGDHYITELLLHNHPRRMQEVMRMSLPTLRQLESFCLANTKLCSQRGVGLSEKLAMFIDIIGHGASNREVQEHFQHSGSTLSLCFQEVLAAMLILHVKYVHQPQLLDPTSDVILQNPKYSPYFDDCVGALDGTHIAMHVPAIGRKPYRNWKGYLSQNVLAAFNFDMKFTYGLAGWEGSAHDGRVLHDTIETKGFQIPAGKYCLGDAGYSNSDYLLVPYKGVRYHLNEQKLASLKPTNAKELFNLRHACLRNIIERIFGVVKRRFRIFDKAPEYSQATQIDIVYAAMGLHNFIKSHPGNEENIYYTPVDIPDDAGSNGGIPTMQSSSTQMNSLRDRMAAKMWEDYEIYLAL